MITKTSYTVSPIEIDGLHIVHHARYPVWFETGRNDFLKKAEIPGYRLKEHGLYLPLTEMKCAFKSPAKYGNEIQIITSLTSLSCAKAKFEYKVLNKADGKLLAAGMTVHAWTNKKIEPINAEKAAPEIYRQLMQLVESEEISVP